MAFGDLRIGDGHLARLHGEHLDVGASLGELFEVRDEREDRFGMVVAEVEDFAGGSKIDGGCDALNDVVYVGEVSLHLSSVVELYRLSIQDRTCEGEVGHIWSSPGAVHGKKS